MSKAPFDEDILGVLKGKLQDKTLFSIDNGSTAVHTVHAIPTRKLNTKLYPCFTIARIDWALDTGRLTQDEFRTYTEDVTDTVDIRDAPVPYEIEYQIDIYTKYASQMAILEKQMLAIFRERYYIEVNGYNLWMFKTDYRKLDSIEGEEPEYRRVYTYRVLTELDEAPNVATPLTQEAIIEPVHAAGEISDGTFTNDGDSDFTITAE